jgi:two-component system, NtrC family, sensor kinase
MQPKVSTAGADGDLVPIVEELKLELSEAHRREAATAEVLKAISRSTFNLQDVLDSLIKSAAELSDAETGLISRPDGEVYRVAAIYNPYSPEVMETVKQTPIPSGRQSASGRAVLERRVVHIHDVFEDPEYTFVGVRNAGVRTILAVPMLRENIVLGVILCARREVRPFTAKQIELVQTFADQAVIAIANTRLFEEVQSRTHELQQSLTYQAATSDVLNVISRSPNTLQPVLDTILATAQKLCGTDRGSIWILQGDEYRLAASIGNDADTVRYFSNNPISPSRRSLVGRVALMKRAVHVPSVMEDVELIFPKDRPTVTPTTMLGVPLMRNDKPIGVIGLSRITANPFTEKQIALVETFADQAVIAIENTPPF